MDFSATQSLFSQVKDVVKRRIFSGEYKPGEKVPALRDLAVELKVNPNTVVRAYAELEAECLIYTESTNGKFVTRDAEVLNRKRDSYIRVLAEEYFSAAKDFGICKEEALSILEENYARTFSDFTRFEIVREAPSSKRHVG